MELTREAYCCYDSAITFDCFNTMSGRFDQNRKFYSLTIETMSRLMSLNVSPLRINKKALSCLISEINKSKPIQPTKDMLVSLGYLKKTDSYALWKLKKALAIAKNEEDKILLRRHVEWAEISQHKNLYMKLMDPRQNNFVIHDVIDFKYTVCNSGLNPVTWRSSIIDQITPVLNFGSIHKVVHHPMTEYFGIDYDDLKLFEFFWKEKIDRDYQIQFSKKKVDCEAYMDEKYPQIEQVKFDIISKIEKYMEFPWTSHVMKFTISKEMDIFSLIFDQSICEAVSNLFLEMNFGKKEKAIVLNNSIGVIDES